MERYAGLSQLVIRQEVENRRRRLAFDPVSLLTWGFWEPFVGLFGVAVFLNQLAKNAGGWGPFTKKIWRDIRGKVPRDIEEVIKGKCDRERTHPKKVAPSPVTYAVYLKWLDRIRSGKPPTKPPKGWPDTRSIDVLGRDPSPLKKIKFELMSVSSAKRLAGWIKEDLAAANLLSYLYLSYEAGRSHFPDWQDDTAASVWQCWLRREMSQEPLISSFKNEGIMRPLQNPHDVPFEGYMVHIERESNKIGREIKRAAKKFERLEQKAAPRWNKMDSDERKKILSDRGVKKATSLAKKAYVELPDEVKEHVVEVLA